MKNINLLTLLVIILIATPLIIYQTNSKKATYTCALAATCCGFYLSSWMYYRFDFSLVNQFQEISSIWKLQYAIDSLSLIFIVLITFIIPLCIYTSFSIRKDYKLFVIYLILIEISLIFSFISINLLMFYIFFEAVLIPMFLLITKWGTRSRKIKAAYYLFTYTLAGSFLLLTAIMLIKTNYGSTDFIIILNLNLQNNNSELSLLWWLLFMAFAVKIPMFPFHIWLPEAHVEAPTVGSIILASLILKLGGYGMLRILFPLTNILTIYYPIAFALSLASVIFASLSTIRQTDLKRIIAYSSIAHMNLVILGLFSQTTHAIQGAIYLMIGHAFVSSLLFLTVGMLYDRHHTRLLRYFGGLVQTMPVFSIVFFIATMANMGFPGTCNFIGEFLIFVGLIDMKTLSSQMFVLLIASLAIVLSAIYSIWLYNRLIFGTIKTSYIDNFTDLNIKELISSLLLVVLILIFGLRNCVPFV